MPERTALYRYFDAGILARKLEQAVIDHVTKGGVRR
jgi:hypothetical protein